MSEMEMEMPTHEMDVQRHEEVKAQSCSFGKGGITVFGLHVSWVVLILIAVVVFYFLHKRGMLSEDVHNVLVSSGPSVPIGISASVNAAPAAPAGDVSRMFSHNKW